MTIEKKLSEQNRDELNYSMYLQGSDPKVQIKFKYHMLPVW